VILKEDQILKFFFKELSWPFFLALRASSPAFTTKKKVASNEVAAF